ncbi:MAG: type II toxin-antitoxin system Phd/YefM family antitoxin [Armatimonadota bacterium]
MTTISAEKARNTFSELVSRTAYTKDRVVVTRNSKKMVAIVPIEDFQLLEKFIDNLEDELDAEEIKAALDEIGAGNTVPWEQVKKDLGL